MKKIGVRAICDVLLWLESHDAKSLQALKSITSPVVSKQINAYKRAKMFAHACKWVRM